MLVFGERAQGTWFLFDALQRKHQFPGWLVQKPQMIAGCTAMHYFVCPCGVPSVTADTP
jgi:hypothetical protein